MPRPEKPIDWDLVDKLLEANCHGTEIAPYFNMHPETFYDRVLKYYGIGFTEFSCLKKAHGDAKLKIAQFEKALDKDNAMMIWLGKQRLDQREPETVKEKFEVTENVQVTVKGIEDAGASILTKASNEPGTGEK